MELFGAVCRNLLDDFRHRCASGPHYKKEMDQLAQRFFSLFFLFGPHPVLDVLVFLHSCELVDEVLFCVKVPHQLLVVPLPLGLLY